jgi:hypothetical protein
MCVSQGKFRGSLGLASESGEIRKISQVAGLGWFYSACAYLKENFADLWVWLVNQERSAKSLRLQGWCGFTVYMLVARKISRILGLASESGEIREISQVAGLGWFYSVCVYRKEDFADLGSWGSMNHNRCLILSISSA